MGLYSQKNVNDSVETLKCFSKIKGVDKSYNHVTNFSNYLIVDSDKGYFCRLSISDFVPLTSQTVFPPFIIY